MKKMFSAIICLGMVLGVFTGCQTYEGEVTVKEESEEATESEGTEGETGMSSDRIYIDMIDDLVSSKKADQFALIDIDGDDVKELAAVSSEGSWEKDQVFVYTVYNGEAVLLASDIAPGMEGHQIAFYEGKNILVISGAAAGECYQSYNMDGGKLKPLRSAESNSISGEIFKTDDKEVSEDEYYESLKEILIPGEEMIVLDTGSMNVKKADYDNGYPEYSDIEERPYMTPEKIQEELGK
ncbi:MAG: hypothetical protein K6B28_14045 [Lachnospiraceae bacterium]|nr:hypothetical protein [Lachnospiraceae bacterium]